MGSDYEDVLIIMPSMLDMIRVHEPSVDELSKNVGSFVYPDGSVQFETGDARAGIRSLMKNALEREANQPKCSLPNSLLTGGAWFMSWAELPHRAHVMLFW